MASQTFQLVMRNGPHPGKVYELSLSELTLGRDVSNHLVINDPEVSRRHARLYSQLGSYIIEDLGSTNGTFVNGQRLLGPYTLRHGDVIGLGETVSLEYQALLFDPNATLLSGSAAAGAPRPATGKETYVLPPEPPKTVPEPYPVEAAAPAPAYSYAEPVPAAAEPYEPPEIPYEAAEPPRKSNRTVLYIGIGCVLIVLCCLVVGAFAFDALNLYCEPPFNQFFNCP